MSELQNILIKNREGRTWVCAAYATQTRSLEGQTPIPMSLYASDMSVRHRSNHIEVVLLLLPINNSFASQDLVTFCLPSRFSSDILCPLYPHHPEVLLNELRSPSELLDFGEFSDCLDFGSGIGAPLLHVVNPTFDYVPPKLVSLFITD
ncbi:hypothetical protein Gotur_029141, partial [Gossypium turneri]